MLLPGAATALLLFAHTGCGSRELPQEVRACMDEIVRSSYRAAVLQYEMTERDHGGGLAVDEVLHYEREIAQATDESRAAADRLFEVAEAQDLDAKPLMDLVLSRCRGYVPGLRKRFPKAAEVYASAHE